MLRAKVFSVDARSHLTTTFATEIEEFFNLLCAHLLNLWPIGSPETKEACDRTFCVSSHPQRQSPRSSTARAFPLATVSPSLHGLIAHPLMLGQLLSKRSHDNVSRSITRSQTSPTQMTGSTCCRSPVPTSRSASKGVGDHVVRGERSLEPFVDVF